MGIATKGFEQYVSLIAQQLGHADRVEPFRGYCTGLLLPVQMWASINGLASLLVPEAFRVSPDVDVLLADWPSRLALFSYYSLAQMITIGYADVTPVRAPATTLSLFSALFGVFYTAVVVSQSVGMARPGERETP